MPPFASLDQTGEGKASNANRGSESGPQLAYTGRSTVNCEATMMTLFRRFRILQWHTLRMQSGSAGEGLGLFPSRRWVARAIVILLAPLAGGLASGCAPVTTASPPGQGDQLSTTSVHRAHSKIALGSGPLSPWGSGRVSLPREVERPSEERRESVAPSSAPAEATWLVDVQRHLAASEYEATRDEENLQAPNRAHNLRTYFGPDGIRLHDRTAPGSPELAAVKLTGLGRPGAWRALGGGELWSEGPRVEIRRTGLVEWYVNSPSGLEQGFTLDERVEGEGPLALEVTVEGVVASRRGEGPCARHGHRPQAPLRTA
jgi:hypothetical protein